MREKSNEVRNVIRNRLSPSFNLHPSEGEKCRISAGRKEVEILVHIRLRARDPLRHAILSSKRKAVTGDRKECRESWASLLGGLRSRSVLRFGRVVQAGLLGSAVIVAIRGFLRLLELELELIQTALQHVLSAVALLELVAELGLDLGSGFDLGSELGFGLAAGRLLRGSRVCLVGLQLRKAPAIELLDELELADTRLEASIGSEERLVGLRDLQAFAVKGRRGTAGRRG